VLNNKTILITGGTGSFGQIFVKYIFEHYQKLIMFQINNKEK